MQILFAALTLLLSIHAFAGLPGYITFPSEIEWAAKNSQHFEVIFRKGSDEIADRALRAAERAHRLTAPIFPEAPPKTYIVIADFQDSTNGYSLDFPYPHIVIYASPPEATSQVSSLEDWFDDIILHEYTHTLHLYPASGLWKALRFLFGTWVLPNGMMPSHFHEGMAVLMETELTKGGRGTGTLFNMFKRQAVASGAWGTTFAPLDRMDGTLSWWPQGTAAYFFGYTLHKELWDRKGRQGIRDLVASYSSNWPYMVDVPLKEIYGITYSKLWEDIYTKTSKETLKEIKRIRKDGLSDLKYLTSSRFHKMDLTFSPDRLKAAFRSWVPKRGLAIEIIDLKTGRIDETVELDSSLIEGMCWVRTTDKDYLLFIEETKEGHYSTNELHWLDLKTKRVNKIDKFNGKNFHQLSCSPSHRLLTYQERSGQGSITEFSFEPEQIEKGGDLKTLRQWKIPPKTWVTSVLSGNPHWITIRSGLSSQFYRWDEGSETPAKIFGTHGHVYNLRLAEDGNLLAIATFDKRDEIWAFDSRGRWATKKIALLGGTNSFDYAGHFILSSYEHGGYDIALPSTLQSQTKALSAEEPPSEPPPTEISPARPYSALGSLAPRTWMPSFLFVPDGIQIGAWVPGFDIAQKHVYDLFGGYDSRGLAFVDFSYAYRFGKSSYAHLGAFLLPNYLLSNKELLKRWGAEIGPGGDLGFWGLQYQLNLLFRRLESSSLTPAKQSVGLGVSLTKKFGFKRHPLAIAPSSGTTVSLSHSQFFKSVGSDDNYFSTVLSLDQYLTSPLISSHVLYLAAKLGYTEGTAFYNSYFEGGGELLFGQGRGFFLNRGFIPGTFIGRRLFTLNAEYRLPIARVDRGIGLWPGRLRNIYASLVSDTTTVDFGPWVEPKNLFKVFYTSAGLELVSNWIFFYYLPTQIRIGGYHGFGPYGEPFYLTFAMQAAF
ncbi:MAG: hypothetical protein HY537_09660 [Deltaproteobacteria bacterium]|nr:hypothetical protein [Deltaproteobacteria bacterium]